MQDVWGRKVNIQSLVIAQPGKSLLKEAFYGIVIGDNLVYDIKLGTVKTNSCYLIEKMTKEQEDIYQRLKVAYNQHMMNITKAGGYSKVVPQPLNIYQGDSATTCYLYLGYLSILVGGFCSIHDDEKFSNGGHLYIKITKGSGVEKRIADLLAEKEITLDYFKHTLYYICNMGYILRATSHNTVGLPCCVVLSTRNRTFLKHIATLNVPGWMANGEEIFTYIENPSPYAYGNKDINTKRRLSNKLIIRQVDKESEE